MTAFSQDADSRTRSLCGAGARRCQGITGRAPWHGNADSVGSQRLRQDCPRDRLVNSHKKQRRCVSAHLMPTCMLLMDAIAGASLVPVFMFGESDLYDQVDNPVGSVLRERQNKLQELFGFAVPLVKGTVFCLGEHCP